MKSEKLTKKHRPQQAVFYTVVVPTTTQKAASSQPPYSVAASVTDASDATIGNSNMKSNPEEDIMYAEVNILFVIILSISDKKKIKMKTVVTRQVRLFGHVMRKETFHVEALAINRKIDGRQKSKW